jgi:uncharacterized protein YecT (DUF1311 family)
MIGFILFAAALSSSPASNADLRCGSRNDQSERECFERLFARADSELNSAYSKVRSQLGRTDRQTLLQTQRAWLRYRDGQCALESSMNRGGTLEITSEVACKARLTRDRTKQLTNYLAGIGN